LLAKSSSSRCPSKERDDTDLMAFLPQEEQDALASRLSLDGAGPRAITHPDRLGEELARTKERGYAVDDEELGRACTPWACPCSMAGDVRWHR
jgi:DNA-binding IclR family transcriptional regulator